MTKRDYERIAHVIAVTETSEQEFRLAIIYALADCFEQDNPRFDRNQFMLACSVGPTAAAQVKRLAQRRRQSA